MKDLVPILDELRSSLGGSDTMVCVADADGYLLQCLVDPAAAPAARQLDLVPGACWHELAKGNNGLGAALARLQPATVMGNDHGSPSLHPVTSFGAPVRAPDGQVLAVLAAFMPARAAFPHCLALVAASARIAEKQLLAKSLHEELLASRQHIDSLTESLSVGLIAIDLQLAVTQIAGMSAQLLGLRPGDSIGRRAADLLCLSMPMDEAGHQATRTGKADLIISRGEDRIPAELRPLKGPYGHLQGYLMTFKANEQVSQTRGGQVVPGRPCRYGFADIIGNSPLHQSAVTIARRAAARSSTVLLLGETGTGKELFAQAIHSASARTSGPFVAVNCGAIPPNLIESELFGYEDGAFTGAKRGGQPGKFERANGGTIFLDEIGDMPLQTQVSLLRVLQERQVTRVGGNHSLAIDVRVVAATHKDLLREVQEGRFRLDLYYRLNVITINIPALRDRVPDVLLMANLFLERLRQQLGLAQVQLSPTAEELLLRYQWPGNVRELENVLERAVNLADGAPWILPHHMPELMAHLETVSRTQNAHPITSLRESEQRTIMDALQSCHGSVAQAARALGISRNTLYRRCKELKVDPSELHTGAGRSRRAASAR